MKAYEKMVKRVTSVKQLEVRHSVGYINHPEHPHQVQISFNALNDITNAGFVTMTPEEALKLGKDLIERAELAKAYRNKEQTK